MGAYMRCHTSPAVGLPPCCRFATAPPSPTADRYVGRQMIHRHSYIGFNHTSAISIPFDVQTGSNSDGGSIQPAAPPFGSPQLLDLGNPLLELDILALLVAVSFVLCPRQPCPSQPETAIGG